MIIWKESDCGGNSRIGSESESMGVALRHLFLDLYLKMIPFQSDQALLDSALDAGRIS